MTFHYFIKFPPKQFYFKRASKQTFFLRNKIKFAFRDFAIFFVKDTYASGRSEARVAKTRYIVLIGDIRALGQLVPCVIPGQRATSRAIRIVWSLFLCPFPVTRSCEDSRVTRGVLVSKMRRIRLSSVATWTRHVRQLPSC